MIKANINDGVGVAIFVVEAHEAVVGAVQVDQAGALDRLDAHLIGLAGHRRRRAFSGLGFQQFYAL